MKERTVIQPRARRASTSQQRQRQRPASPRLWGGARLGRWLLAAVALLVLGGAGAVLAQQAPADLMAPNSFAPVEAPPTAMTVEQATRLVRKRTGGRVLAAEQTFRRGQPGVSVRVLIEGARVVTLFVDEDGRIRGR